MPLARISLTLSHHFSLSFIASGRFSGLHPVSSHSCCMYVRAGRPAFATEILILCHTLHWHRCRVNFSGCGFHSISSTHILGDLHGHKVRVQFNMIFTLYIKPQYSLISWSFRRCWQHLSRGIRPPTPLTSVLGMKLNHLIMRLQSWSLREYEVPLHSYYSLVYCNPEWWYLLGSHLWVK